MLGPLEVHGAAGRLPIGGVKRQGVLVALLLRAGEMVSTDRLVETLWGEAPPRSAPSNVRTYVSDLRRVLAGTAQVSSVGVGYRIEVDPGEVDLHVFHRLADEGEEAVRAGQHGRAVEVLTEALGLWRGRAFGGVELGPWVDAAATALEDRRWAVSSALVEALTGAERGDDAICVLREMVAERPFAEGTWAQLVGALHRAGRTAEALAVFGKARDVLRAELGLDPGPQLKDAQRRVLAAVPRGLPPGPADFAGRRNELNAIVTATSRMTVVCGPPGIGKSALVLRAAERLAPSFPDGQLYHAVTRGTGEALTELLCALGIRREDVPAEIADRATAYRSLLAERRVLIVLDGAREVAPFVLGAGQSRVLVSTRRIPSGFEAIRLGPLKDREAVRVLGIARAANEPQAAHAVLRACAGNARALKIIAERLALRPGMSLARLADRMTGTGVLDELAIGTTSVRAEITTSLDALSPNATRALRALATTGSASGAGRTESA
ncbi:MAG TPA: BTAD domain-containing putative transcriptional regulator, partial [Lentzea sp.]